MTYIWCLFNKHKFTLDYTKSRIGIRKLSKLTIFFKITIFSIMGCTGTYFRLIFRWADPCCCFQNAHYRVSIHVSDQKFEFQNPEYILKTSWPSTSFWILLRLSDAVPIPIPISNTQLRHGRRPLWPGYFTGTFFILKT